MKRKVDTPERENAKAGSAARKDKPPKKPRTSTKGKATCNNEAEWPEYFHSVSERIAFVLDKEKRGLDIQFVLTLQAFQGDFCAKRMIFWGTESRSPIVSDFQGICEKAQYYELFI
jgi:hypothetical protein